MRSSKSRLFRDQSSGGVSGCAVLRPVGFGANVALANEARDILDEISVKCREPRN